jgi:hypothetical protein
MNAQVGVLLAVGVLGGLAVVALLAAFQPAAAVRLDDALDRLDERIAVRQPRGTATPSGWRHQFDRRWTALALRLPGTVPTEDLQVIGWSRERFLVARLTATVQFAALLGPGLALLSAVISAPLPPWVPAVGTLGGAVLGFMSTASKLARRATAARQEMRHATVSYLRQVALLSQSGSGVVSALTRPTTLATNSWAFGRLRAQLDLARRAGEQPWEGLRRFGEEVNVDELSDLSDIAAGAGADGSAVVSTLIERADSLTAQMQTEQRAAQNRASDKMNSPSVAMVWVIAVWIGYPMISLLMQG